MIYKLLNKFKNNFTETIFYKKESELELQIEALKKLNEEYPNNEAIKQKLRISEIGLKGEKEIEFELKNANIGMYVLHDINMEYKGTKAQTDYLVITPGYTYFIECKNLVGDITVNNRGDFIREYSYGGRRKREGIYSPVRQVQRHVDVFKKIWTERNQDMMSKIFMKKRLAWFKPLVVVANHKSILNLQYAPVIIKGQVIRSDALVEYIKKDLRQVDRDLISDKETMHQDAFSIMQNYNKDIDIDYEQEFRKLVKEEDVEPSSTEKVLKVRAKLVAYRKEKSKKKNIPAYYVFTNDELDKLLLAMPKTKKELIASKILSSTKLRCHGEEIVKIIKEG